MNIQDEQFRYLYHSVAPYAELVFDRSQLQVFKKENITLLGEECVVEIVGQSHFIYSEDLGFEELCSCVPVIPTLSCIDLEQSEDMMQTATFELDQVTVSVETKVVPIESVDVDLNQGISYDFSQSAYTIVVPNSLGYDTFHTYPQYGKTVVTKTTLQLK